MAPKIYIKDTSKNNHQADKSEIKRKITEYLNRLGINSFEVGIYFVNQKEIRRLNRDYRNKDQTTDVISFPIDQPLKDDIKEQDSKEYVLGDIFISITDIKDKNFDQELTKAVWQTIKHGLVHLLGINHNNKEEQQEFNNYLKK